MRRQAGRCGEFWHVQLEDGTWRLVPTWMASRELCSRLTLAEQPEVSVAGLGQAGAVLSTEVSRFARNNRDWYQLLDLCGLMNTLIVDAEGIYDTRQPNDRLLLGLKGTMSEAELGWLRQRAYAAAMGKAKRGELLLGMPTGFVRSPDGRIEKHPDRRVQEAIQLVFAKFAELGSVRQVILWFRQEKIEVPTAGNDTSWAAGQLATARVQLDVPHPAQSDLRRGLCLRTARDRHHAGRGRGA